MLKIQKNTTFIGVGIAVQHFKSVSQNLKCALEFPKDFLITNITLFFLADLPSASFFSSLLLFQTRTQTLAAALTQRKHNKPESVRVRDRLAQS